MRFFFKASGLGGLCALWGRSDSTSGADKLCLSFLLNSENTGRLFESGGGELSSAGDEGGEDLAGASEVGIVGGGLELRAAELTRAGDKGSVGDSSVGPMDGEGIGSTFSTRLRLVGGSSS